MVALCPWNTREAVFLSFSQLYESAFTHLDLRKLRDNTTKTDEEEKIIINLTVGKLMTVTQLMRENVSFSKISTWWANMFVMSIKCEAEAI